jgi:hypothetical protein
MLLLPPPTSGPSASPWNGWSRPTCASPDEAARQRYDYAAPVFDFACRLTYDESGLVLDYLGIAVRAR